MNARDAGGSAPLHYVKSVEMAKLLLEAGANPSAKVEEYLGFLPYQNAGSVTDPRPELYWFLFDAANPFHAAARRNDVEAMRALTDTTDIHAPDLAESYTPARLAAEHNALEALLFLLEQGVDINANTDISNNNSKRSGDQRTLSDAALISRSNRCLDYLLKHGGEVGVGWIMRACSNADEKLDGLRTLIANGYDLNCVDKFGYTPLHHAGSAELVEFLLKLGLSIDQPTKRGGTPLQEACANGHETAAIALIESGAKINIASKHDGATLRTALDFALQYPDDRGAMIAKLRAHGAKTAQELGVV